MIEHKYLKNNSDTLFYGFEFVIMNMFCIYIQVLNASHYKQN